MQMTGNTILITGGGSGIGRGLAEAFYARGNTVIISGRRRTALETTVAANPVMAAVELDVTDPASIASVAASVVRDHPTLNVLLNNAGIMQADAAAGQMDEEVLSSTIATNLMGPIRLTSALLDHLRTQDSPVIAYTTSVLAYVPMAMTAVYSATKAALHSYVLSQRFLLRDSGVRVLEIAPPWTRTELMNSSDVAFAMPLDAFIAETMEALDTDANEILVERARPMRTNVGPAEAAMVTEFNERALAFYQG